MDATLVNLRLIAPELSSESDDRLNLFLSMSESNVNASVWGSKTAMAICLMTAHFVTLANQKGQGSIASQSVGGVSVSYSSSSANKEFQSTSYGKMYLSLQKTLIITPFTV